ncbi:MAG: hypothetical protein MR494_09840, partial [Spirochaetia bacterium]|nr:hypothetical protein [Spirochaetia bacterium]
VFNFVSKNFFCANWAQRYQCIHVQRIAFLQFLQKCQNDIFQVFCQKKGALRGLPARGGSGKRGG